ncbi:hypothetical protein TNCV_1912631 [Trichonephila clavipes]|nr:hypothetical protein TNCV_1912631 [Trichonephila clavipes]
MDVCKRIVPSRHGNTLNSCRDASPLVMLVEREVRWQAPDLPQGVLAQNWGKPSYSGVAWAFAPGADRKFDASLF